MAPTICTYFVRVHTVRAEYPKNNGERVLLPDESEIGRTPVRAIEERLEGVRPHRRVQGAVHQRATTRHGHADCDGLHRAAIVPRVIVSVHHRRLT